MQMQVMKTIQDTTIISITAPAAAKPPIVLGDRLRCRSGLGVVVSLFTAAASVAS